MVINDLLKVFCFGIKDWKPKVLIMKPVLTGACDEIVCINSPVTLSNEVKFAILKSCF